MEYSGQIQRPHCESAQKFPASRAILSWSQPGPHPTTAEVCLTDFSRAVRTVSEPQVSLPLSLPSSTLAYLLPEQTGRMNRGVDYRTDFYALGVIFYELLTGSLPFHAEDTLELIQCHLAKLPLPPSAIAAADLQPVIDAGLLLLTSDTTVVGTAATYTFLKVTDSTHSP